MEGLFNFLPEGLTLGSATLLIIASFFTSGLTAFAGVGGGLLMLGLMTYIIPIAALIPVHGLVQLGSNSGRSYVQRANIDWRVTKLFLLGSMLGATLGAILFVQLPAWLLQGMLGLFIITIIWLKFPALVNANSIVISLGGILTTFISMFAGATGPLVAVFLNNIFSQHKHLVATHGATMTVQHGLKVVAFIASGFAFWQWMPLVMLIVLSGFLGTKVGTHVMLNLPEKYLKLCFKAIMTFIAIDLIRQGFFNSY